MSSVAKMPAIEQLSERLGVATAFLKKVPMRYWRLAVMAFALMWITHTLANLVWVIIPAPKVPVAPVVPITAKDMASKKTERKVDLAGVLKAELFGKYVEPAEVPETPVETQQEIADSHPVTSLDVTLEGVLASDDPAFSSAIIMRSNQQKIYKVDEELEGFSGVKIKSIETLRVVLDNRGKLEELWLYGEDGKKFVTQRTAYTPPSRPSAEPSTRSQIDRNQVKDVKTISDVVRFMVATEGGKMIGYKVRPGRKRELFEQAGLKTNDIVVSVNGIQVNEPQKVREVYQALKNATEANLEVLRDGTTQTIQISMSSEG